MEAFQKYAQSRTHAAFVEILPSEKHALLSSACHRLPFPASLVTFVSSPGLSPSAYAVVRLHDREEFVTYLVCHKSRSQERNVSQAVYFENGHYGYKGNEGHLEAVQDMFNRAHRF